MNAWELIAFGVNIPTDVDPATPFFGDNATLRPSNGKLVKMWSEDNLPEGIYIRSARFHDINSIQMETAGITQNLIPMRAPQKLFAGDVLAPSMQSVNGETAADMALLIHYENIPNLKTRYIDCNEFDKRYTGNLISAGVTLTTPTAPIDPTLPNLYGTPVALSASGAYFKRDKQYALLGYNASATIGLCITWRGFCTGNLRVGGPMSQQSTYPQLAEYFLNLSEKSRLPAIPVMNGLEASTVILEATSAVSFDQSVLIFSLFGELEPLI